MKENIYIINIRTNTYDIVDSFEQAEKYLDDLAAEIGHYIRWDYIVLDEEGFKQYMADGNK